MPRNSPLISTVQGSPVLSAVLIEVICLRSVRQCAAHFLYTWAQSARMSPFFAIAQTNVLSFKFVFTSSQLMSPNA